MAIENVELLQGCCTQYFHTEIARIDEDKDPEADGKQWRVNMKKAQIHKIPSTKITSPKTSEQITINLQFIHSPLGVWL